MTEPKQSKEEILDQIQAFFSQDQNKHFSRVVLQAEDSLLESMPEIILTLKKEFPEKDFFLSCDNCRNPCCVDFIAANHKNADLVVKLGDSCLSEKILLEENTKHPQVFYCLPKKKLDGEKLANLIAAVKDLLKESSEKTDYVKLFLDTEYTQSETVLAQAIKEGGLQESVSVLCYKQKVVEENGKRYLTHESRLIFNSS